MNDDRLPHLAGAELDLDELSADLTASGGADDIGAWISRPAVARRIALHIARRLPATIDRIVTAGPEASALAASVGLVTGLPWATVEAAAVGTGAIHPGEQIAVITAFASDIDDAVQAVRDRRAAPGAVLAIISSEAPNGMMDGSPVHSLFIRDGHGDLHQGAST